MFYIFYCEHLTSFTVSTKNSGRPEKIDVTNEGVRTDVLSDEVDKIMNGNKDLGLGTVELKTVGRVNPAKDYFGRTLVYRSVDFNRVI